VVKYNKLYKVDQKRGHYGRPLDLTPHIFKTHETICMISGALRRRFVLNTPVMSKPHQIYNRKRRRLANASNPDFAFDD